MSAKWIYLLVAVVGLAPMGWTLWQHLWLGGISDTARQEQLETFIADGKEWTEDADRVSSLDQLASRMVSVDLPGRVAVETEEGADVKALVDSWNVYAQACDLIRRMVEADRALAREKDSFSPDGLANLLAELQSIDQALVAANQGDDKIHQTIGNHIDWVKRSQRLAPQVARVLRILGEATTEFDKGNHDRLAELESQFKAAAQALSSEPELMESFQRRAERIWQRSSFRRRMTELLEDGLLAALSGDTRQAQDAAAAIDSFLNRHPDVPADADDRYVYRRVQRAAKSLRTAPPAGGDTLIVLFVTKDYLDMQSEIRPEVQSVLVPHAEHVIGRCVFAITKEESPRREQARFDMQIDPSLAFDEDYPLAEVFSRGQDLLEDLVLVYKRVPRTAEFIWASRADPSLFATSSKSFRLKDRYRVNFYWLGTSENSSRQLTNWFGKNGGFVNTYSDQLLDDLSVALSFALTGS